MLSESGVHGLPSQGYFFLNAVVAESEGGFLWGGAAGLFVGEGDFL